MGFVSVSEQFRFDSRAICIYVIRYSCPVTAATAIRTARIAAGFTQKQLAALAGTSQPNVAAYESGARVPETSTFLRLIDAAGARVRIETGHRPLRTPSRAELEKVSRTLSDVLDLASKLPTEHPRELTYPRLPS